MALDKNVILEKKKECQKYVLNNFNLDNFELEFENFMKRNLN